MGVLFLAGFTLFNGPMDWTNSGALVEEAGDFHLFCGDHKWSVHPSESGPVLYLPDFYMDAKEPWLSFEECHKVSTHEVLLPGDDSSAKWTWSTPSRQNFVKHFEQIHHWIQAGEIEKMVPVVTAESAYSSAHHRHLLRHLLKPSSGLCSYGFWIDQEGLMGKTPEVLLRRRGNQYSTMALAGTAQVHRRSEADFLADPKERHEHQVVIDDIVKRLSEFGDVKVGITGVHRIDPLMHLKTEIHLTGPDWDLETAAKTLHPTPALGVAPRSRSNLLQELDSKRNRFGAPFGVRWSRENWLILVAIRNVEFGADQARLQSGCGVVKDSVLDSEWVELQHKRDAVATLFGMNQ